MHTSTVVVNYKLSTICHNCFYASFPAYLSELLTVYTPSDKFILLQTHGHFTSPMLKINPLASVLSLPFTPKQWNSLPSDTHHIQSAHASKTALKTHLYKQYHNN